MYPGTIDPPTQAELEDGSESNGAVEYQDPAIQVFSGPVLIGQFRKCFDAQFLQDGMFSFIDHLGNRHLFSNVTVHIMQEPVEVADEQPKSSVILEG